MRSKGVIAIGHGIDAIPKTTPTVSLLCSIVIAEDLSPSQEIKFLLYDVAPLHVSTTSQGHVLYELLFAIINHECIGLF